MKTFASSLKHQPEYDAPMDDAERFIRSPQPIGAPTPKDACPFIFTSNHADAWWICLWSIYHNGRRPLAVRKSSGNAWRVMLPGYGYEVRVEVQRPDHREGIVIL